MEHVIPRNWITDIETKHRLMSSEIRLKYADTNGGTHSLKLIPKDAESFLRALGKK